MDEKIRMCSGDNKLTFYGKKGYKEVCEQVKIILAYNVNQRKSEITKHNDKETKTNIKYHTAG